MRLMKKKNVLDLVANVFTCHLYVLRKSVDKQSLGKTTEDNG